MPHSKLQVSTEKWPTYTMARLDVWSAGIMLLTILSKQYLFFTAHDHAESLVEISGIFCAERIVQMGKNHCAKVVTFDSMAPPRPPLQLRGLSLLMRPASDVSFTPDEPHDFCQIAVQVVGKGPGCLCEPEWKRRKLLRMASRNSDQTVHKFKKKCEEKTVKNSVEPVKSDVDDFHKSSVYELLSDLLRVDPSARLTTEEALKHTFFSEG